MISKQEEWKADSRTAVPRRGLQRLISSPGTDGPYLACFGTWYGWGLDPGLDPLSYKK